MQKLPIGVVLAVLASACSLKPGGTPFSLPVTQPLPGNVNPYPYSQPLGVGQQPVVQPTPGTPGFVAPTPGVGTGVSGTIPIVQGAVTTVGPEVLEKIVIRNLTEAAIDPKNGWTVKNVMKGLFGTNDAGQIVGQPTVHVQLRGDFTTWRNSTITLPLDTTEGQFKGTFHRNDLPLSGRFNAAFVPNGTTLDAGWLLWTGTRSVNAPTGTSWWGVLAGDFNTVTMTVANGALAGQPNMVGSQTMP